MNMTIYDYACSYTTMQDRTMYCMEWCMIMHSRKQSAHTTRMVPYKYMFECI